MGASVARGEEEMKFLETFFNLLVFPGLLFAASAGLLAGWVDRKLTARLQWRVGPPWYQNFMDILKLFYKETILPKGSSSWMFFGMPLAALASATLFTAAVAMACLEPRSGFVGDFIVVVYLAVMPSLALMFGGAASANPLASVGASREMKLILSYELPFIICSAVPIIKSGYSLRLAQLLQAQAQNGIFVLQPSGILAFIVALFVIQAKLGFVPFDMAEAETEIMAGPTIEYSGKALAMWKLAKSVLTVGLPVLLITMFFGGFGQGFSGALTGIGKYLLILVLMILIKNTNPRVRIDQALRFFWGPMTLMALLAVGFALIGR